MPKVSVIIPTFNRAEFLHSAITSVLNQTFQDFEILVIDDASEDQTQEVVNRFHDTRITYLHHEANRGEACARNSGIVNSKGEFIAFLDDDDSWLPDKLNLQVNMLNGSNAKIGLIYSGFRVIDGKSKMILSDRIPDKRGEVYENILYGNFVGTPSTVILRRDCINKVGLFDRNIAYGLDHDLWIRIAKCYHFDCIRSSLVLYHRHENRLSNNPAIKAKGLEDMVKKYGKHIIMKNKYYQNSYLSIGVQFCYNGDIRNGIKAFVNAIRVKPFNIRNYFNLGCALFGAKNFRRMKSLKDKLLIPLRGKRPSKK
jgi:glycosyltransferase involved in cell wall biosynthesis